MQNCAKIIIYDLKLKKKALKFGAFGNYLQFCYLNITIHFHNS